MTNVGKAPAVRVRWFVWVAEDPRFAILRDVHPRSNWVRKTGDVTLAPGASIQVSVGWKTSFRRPPLAPQLGESAHVLVLVKYADAFSVEHKTRLCIGGRVSADVNALADCYTHNYAD